MANFGTTVHFNHDDYMTPKSAWEDISHLIPRDKILWEAFYGDGKSGEYLNDLGFKVIHENIDFFEHDKGDIVVSNPPFSLTERVVKRLIDINKPFILILPNSKINRQYFRDIILENGNFRDLQIIIPKRRISFYKMENGTTSRTGCANFDCFYYCWKMNLENDIMWLE